MKEYIIYGTWSKNLESILKDGFIAIDTTNKKDNLIYNKISDKNQIFTQLIYPNIPNEKIQLPHWGNYAIVLDKKILKDYPSCWLRGFSYKFNNTYKVLTKTKGKLKRMPNLTKLKNIINNSLDNVFSYFSDYANFVYSHAILFNKNIPLKKYCLCIVVNGEMEEIPQKIIKLAGKLEIPIKKKSKDTYPYYRGINNFIDIIEK